MEGRIPPKPPPPTTTCPFGLNLNRVVIFVAMRPPFNVACHFWFNDSTLLAWHKQIIRIFISLSLLLCFIKLTYRCTSFRIADQIYGCLATPLILWLNQAFCSLNTNATDTESFPFHPPTSWRAGWLVDPLVYSPLWRHNQVLSVVT